MEHPRTIRWSDFWEPKLDALISEQTTPTAWRVRAFMNRWAQMAHVEGGNPVAVNLKGLDEVRKVLVAAKPGNPQDTTAIYAMRDAFDDWTRS